MQIRTLVFATIAMFFALFFVAIHSHAADLCFEWDYSTDDQANITGFRLLEDTHANVKKDAISPDSRTVCIAEPTDGLRHGYFLVAYNATGVSENSDIAYWPVDQVLVDPAPVDQFPGGVKKFILTLESVQ